MRPQRPCQDISEQKVVAVFCSVDYELSEKSIPMFVVKCKGQTASPATTCAKLDAHQQNSFKKWTKISSLEIGLKIYILKFTKPLQSCCCSVQKICLERLNWPGWIAGISEGGLVNFKIKNPRPLFTIILNSKMEISRLEILVHLLKEFQLVWMGLVK